MRTIHAASAPVVAGLAMLAGAAPASATPTLTFDQSCVAQTQTFGVTGTGYPPGRPVRLDSTGPSGNVVADAAGNFSGQLTAPSAGQGPIVVTAKDGEDSRIEFATAQLMYVRPRILVLPTRVQAKRAFRISVRGFSPGQPVYAHVRRSGQWIRTRQLGMAAGPCGTLSVKIAILRNLIKKRFDVTFVTLQVDQAPAASVTQRPAGIANLILRTPAGRSYPYTRMQVLSRSFRLPTSAGAPIP